MKNWDSDDWLTFFIGLGCGTILFGSGVAIILNSIMEFMK